MSVIVVMHKIVFTVAVYKLMKRAKKRHNNWSDSRG